MCASPTIERGREPGWEIARLRRQLHETIRACEAEEITRTVGGPWRCPCVHDRDRDELGHCPAGAERSAQRDLFMGPCGAAAIAVRAAGMTYRTRQARVATGLPGSPNTN